MIQVDLTDIAMRMRSITRELVAGNIVRIMSDDLHCFDLVSEMRIALTTVIECNLELGRRTPLFTVEAQRRVGTIRVKRSVACAILYQTRGDRRERREVRRLLREAYVNQLVERSMTVMLLQDAVGPYALSPE